MGRKYYKPHNVGRSGKAGLIGALLSAILNRGRGGVAPYSPQRSSFKGSILRFILGRLFKRH